MIDMGLFSRKETPLVTIETERLRIIPLTRAEFDKKRTEGFGDDEFKEAMEELAERAKHDRAARFAWYTNRLIYRKTDHAYIGSIACMNAPEKDPDKMGLVEIGYATELAFRRQGYMTEAVGALCAWILEQPNVHGIIAGVLDGNLASCRVLEKNGFDCTDHSDMLGLQVWKKIPSAKHPAPKL